MMYLKQRDKDILNFIEDNQGITVQLCADLFYQNCNKDSAYISASRRLRTMYNNNFIKRWRKTINDEYSYYQRGSSPLGYHRMKLLEVYGKLSKIGKIIRFEKGFRIGEGKGSRENDGLIEIEIEEGEYFNTYPIIIEIDYSHETSWAKIKEIYKNGAYQEMYSIMPIVLIVKKYEHMKRLQSNDDITIINVNWNLEGIEDIFK